MELECELEPKYKFRERHRRRRFFRFCHHCARTITLGQNITLGQINFNGANNYTIAGANTLTFDVSSGRASINVNNTLGNGAHTISAALSLNDSLDLVQNSAGNFTMSGVISGANGITKTGTGVLILSGPNTFSGGLTLSAGTLSVGNNSAAGTETLTLGGGTIQANSATARTIANAVNLSGDTTVAGSGALTIGTGLWRIAGGNRTLTVNNSAATTISSVIGQDVAGRGLTKSGTGTLVLSGVNTFSGVSRLISAGGQIKNESLLGLIPPQPRTDFLPVPLE